MMKLWVRLCVMLVRPIIWWIGPLKVFTLGYPKKGGFVLVCNHLTEGDPVALQTACKRHIRFMGKVELFRIPVLGWYLRSIGTFPVRQFSADKGAVRKAVKLLEKGQVVGIFPEGIVNRTGQELLPLTAGAVMIARRAQVPIIVCIVKNTDKVWTKPGSLVPHGSCEMEVHFGRTFFFDASSNEQAAQKVETEMRRLLRLHMGASGFRPRTKQLS
jgi:1-acyl-sn-glycerol-3-phosphate acyltransferase